MCRYYLLFSELRLFFCFFFFSSRRRHTRLQGDWSSDVCSSDLEIQPGKGVRINGPHSGRARMHRAYATPALGTLSPRQLIELRLVLEPGWAALAAVRADDSGLRQLQWTQSQLAHALARSDLLDRK